MWRWENQEDRWKGWKSGSLVSVTRKAEWQQPKRHGEREREREIKEEREEERERERETEWRVECAVVL